MTSSNPLRRRRDHTHGEVDHLIAALKQLTALGIGTRPYSRRASAAAPRMSTATIASTPPDMAA